MTTTSRRYRLLMGCPDHPGIIHRVSGILASMHCNIVAFDQHSEGPDGGFFFMRAEFDAPLNTFSETQLGRDLEALNAPLMLTWKLRAQSAPYQLAILVSREGHCLEELAWEVERGDIHARIGVVISNHPHAAAIAEQFHLPFYAVDVTPDNKSAAERQILEILQEYHIDTVVLARYMQILTPGFIERYPTQIINIHHSFLPAFVGANPYRQAYQRGVKLIGATAHYVTADLDAGPIIEQDVHRVDHRHQIDDYKRIGRTVERMVLARAVKWHVEDRVLRHGNRTIVFPI